MLSTEKAFDSLLCMKIRKKKPTLLILNGSLHGSKKNCGEILRFIRARFKSQFSFLICNLNDHKSSDLIKQISSADALLVLSGTYWESWGSPLQRFFEDYTHLETHSFVMGKPAAAIVLCHSTGGKSVLSRILANLNMFGFVIPPLCGIELSYVAQVARTSRSSELRDDLWSLEDLEVMIHNLLECIKPSLDYRSWIVDKKNYRKKWVRSDSR